MEFYVVAANADTGQVKYFDKRDMAQDNYSIFKASCAIPYACKPYPVRGTCYYDGAVSDPVPVKKAFELGCDRVVLILTKPADLIRTPEKDEKLAAHIQKKHPAAAANLRLRAQRYNEGVALAKAYAAQGKALIVAPDDTCGVDTLKKSRESIQRLYEKGLKNGQAIPAFLAG